MNYIYEQIINTRFLAENFNSEKSLENTTIFKGVIKNLNKYGYNIYASCIIPINVQILKNILKT